MIFLGRWTSHGCPGVADVQIYTLPEQLEHLISAFKPTSLKSTQKTVNSTTAGQTPSAAEDHVKESKAPELLSNTDLWGD